MSEPQGTTDAVLTRTRLVAGIWEGIMTEPVEGVEPRIGVRHEGTEIPGVEVLPEGSPGLWLVRVPIPQEAISDGVQTFVVLDRVNGETLTSFSIVAGEPLADDLRSEIDLLRSELDLLKRAFRRHCVETMDDGQP